MKSKNKDREYILDATPEYFNDYISNQTHHYGDYLDLEGSDITDLGSLENVGSNLNLQETDITSLGNINSVGGHLSLSYTGITSLDNLNSVGGGLFLIGVKLISLGKLEHVSGKIYCSRGSSTHKLLMNSKFKDQIRLV